MSDDVVMAHSVRKWNARAVIGALAAAILGLTFLIAAAPKALDPVAFAEQIRLEGLDFVLPAGLLAWLVIVVEACLGAALILNLRRRLVLIPTGLLVALFVFLTARSYLRWLRGDLGEVSSCGCFGNLMDRTPGEAFWQDLVLLVPPFLVAALIGRGGAGGARSWRFVAVGLVTLATAILAWMSPRLPLDDAATRLGVGERIVEFCAGAGKPGAERVCLDILVPELLAGRHVAVVDDLDRAGIEATVDTLNRFQEELPDASVWLLADASDERLQAFFWEWGPRFEVREVPLPLLRPLYRTLPRAFAVENGVVVRTWAGLPDSEEAAD